MGANVTQALARLLQLPPLCTEATLHLCVGKPPMLTVTQILTQLQPGELELASTTTQFELRAVTPLTQAPFDIDAEVEAAKHRLALFIDERCKRALVGMRIAAILRQVDVAALVGSNDRRHK